MARLRRSGMAPRRRHALLAAVAALVLALVVSFSLVDPKKLGGGSKGTIVIGNIPAWTDIRSSAYLWGNRLEALGYDVEYQVLSEPAPMYAGLAAGDININPSAWTDITHKPYMDKFRDDVEMLGTFNDSAMNMLAVPEYSSIDSIEDLKGKSGQFDGRIVGIEPGAGLTKTAQTKVIPDYGLQEYELVTSSTTAMLSELQAAMKKKDDIVVTLWKPYWAKTKFPVKELKDPKKSFGDGEGMNILGNKGFAEEFPEAAEYLGKVKLTDDQYGDLENTVVNEFGEGQEEEAVEAWLERNPDVLPPVEG
ncbi:glycine betaine ABC transporter substrate-binding protein [Luteococcus sp. OSA5]|uniref:glycine betaine ABC transporter substrate-binding protein n=1 Tax=Luteococcus sp. OSA5 TaxID=3401630 RepID=UPI003B429E0F